MAPRSASFAKLAPTIAILVVAVLAASWTIRHEFEAQREQAAARLDSLGDLRRTQVESWLARQMNLADFLKHSGNFADMFNGWRDRGDTAAGAALLARSIEFRAANEADGVLIVDPEGTVLAGERSDSPEQRARDGTPELRAAMHAAVLAQRATHTTIYRNAGGNAGGNEMPLRLDVAVPLLRSGTPARGGLVLRIDAGKRLFPMLAAWPVPSATGESVLWQRQGDRLVNLGNTRGASDNADRIAQPLAGSALAVAQVLRGAAPANTGFVAVDPAGERVLASVRQVAGTDWWLESRMSLEEVDEPAWRYARWTLLASIGAVLGVALLTRLLSQHGSLQQARRAHAEHWKQLEALGLLEAIAQSSSDAIFAKDLQGRYMFYNRGASETVGKPRDEVVGRTDLEVFGAEAASIYMHNDALALRSPNAHVFEEHVATPGGERVVMSTKGPLFDRGGRLIGVVGVARDVTEARRAERAQRESDAHYRTVVSALSEGVMVSDPLGNVLSCNPAAEAITGCSEAAWKGMDVVAPGWAPQRDDGTPMPPLETPPGRVLSGEPALHRVPLTARNPSGETRYLEVSSAPVISPDTGKLTVIVTTFSDVTERQALEAELRQHRNRLEGLVAERTHELSVANQALLDAARFNRAISDTVPGRVAYWDAELRCGFANKSYAEWFKLTPEQMLGRSMREIFGEVYYARVEARFKAALGGEPQHYENELPLDDGSGETVMHQVHYIPEWPTGEPVRGVYVIAFDITSLKRTQADLRSANDELAHALHEAEAATRMKSAFLANMSHEIRTPMNAIIGLSHLLGRDVHEPSQRERLSKIGDAGQHLLKVIDDILDLSKIEAAKLQLDEADFSVDIVLTRAFEMVGADARSKGLELVLDTDHLPARMRGDSTRLSQMLINLLSNAVKFTERGWVRLRGELLAEDGARLQVRFEVQDTGEGIAFDRQARLFNAFEQADNSATRRHGGTGLGLALTRQLALAMGGEAGVTSVPGEGSTFWFTAWLARPQLGDAGPPAPERAAARARTHGMRALLVDDLPEARSVIEERLRMMGIEVDALGSGLEALARVEAEAAAGRSYDVVLMDWRMAPIDGIETLRRMHALLGDGMPPSILVTAMDEPAMRAQARDMHCEQVLVKPITTSALNDALMQALRAPSRSPSRAPHATSHSAGSGAAPGACEAMLRRRHAGKRVLLAEDNPINREIADELLSAASLVVETAADGQLALELALTRSYDLILMDVQMPRMDGLQATREIRQRARSATPIVAMTANAFVEDRAACLAAGMNDHVAKPVDPETLYATLLRWLPGGEANGGGAAPAPASAPAPTRMPLTALTTALTTTQTAAHTTTKIASRPLPERLAAIEGLDVNVGLRSVNGQVPVLARVLGRFVGSYRFGHAPLLDAREADLAARWRTACHSIRGACGAIGAERLVMQCEAFERALKSCAQPQELAPRAREVNDALMLFTATLAATLAAELEG